MKALYAIPVLALAAPAQADNVQLSATLTNSCVLSVGSAGVMAASADGTNIGSEETGGSAATLSVVAIGTLPTVNVGAPSLVTSPAGWSAAPTLAIRYTSTGGANQAYTSSSSSATLSRLSDTLTIHGRVSSSSGFAAGSYTLRTVVTCSQ